ncbi:hypothetical protein O3M35_003667 [Rhynocoris fuscipes]|uniref:Uncharacterized protein n=1 Tax=Rhynocoris fuscipes TaxID=488301 RepID=A0AAW1CL77_9HEMI
MRLIHINRLLLKVISAAGEDGKEVQTMTDDARPPDQQQSVNDKIKSLQNLLYPNNGKYQQPSSLEDRASDTQTVSNDYLVNSMNRLKRQNFVGHHHPCACIPRHCACYHDNDPNKAANLNNPLYNCNQQTGASCIKCLPRNYCACNANPICNPRGEFTYNSNNQNLNPFPNCLPNINNNNEQNINANPVCIPSDYTYNRNNQICPTPNDCTYNRNDQLLNPNPICPTPNDCTYNRNDQLLNPNPICPTPNDCTYNRNDQLLNPICPTPNDCTYNRNDQLLNPNPLCPTPNDCTYNRNDQVINPNPLCQTPNTYNSNNQILNPNPVFQTPNTYNNNDQIINPHPICPTPNDCTYNRNDQVINPNPICPTPNDCTYNRNDQIINQNPICPTPAYCNNYCSHCIPQAYPYHNNNNHMVPAANTVGYNSANAQLQNVNPENIEYETRESNRPPQKVELNENRAFGLVAQASPAGAREVIYDQEQRKETEITYGTPAPNAFRYSVEQVGNRFQEVSKATGLAKVPQSNTATPALQNAPPTIVDESNVSYETSDECCIPKSEPEPVESYSEEEAAANQPYHNCCCDCYDPAMECPVKNSCDYSSRCPNRTELNSVEEENTKKPDVNFTRGFTIGVSQNRILGNAIDHKAEARNDDSALKDIKELQEGDVVGEFRGRILFAKQGLTLSVDHLSLPYLEKYS